MEIVDIEREVTIPRAADGRPRIYTWCEECSRTGRVPGARANTTKKCPTCKGEGATSKLYTRMTTFIDCLEDKSNLSKWKQRITALGLSREPGILEAFRELADPMGEDRSKADALVKRAEEAGDAGLKASLGDALHAICEQINQGKDPGFIPDEFVPDVEAYREALRLQGIVPVQVETFVVNDRRQAGGSFDILGLHYGKPLETRNGRLLLPSGVTPKLKIMDIKTGRIDYGRSKIAMQLGGYSESVVYSPVDYSRKPINHVMPGGGVLEVDVEEALIIHLPAGQGLCEVVPVDIGKARKGLDLALAVRDWRREKFHDDPITTVSHAELCK